MREHRRKYGPDSPFFGESDEVLHQYAISKLQLGYLPSVEGINTYATRKELEAMRRSPRGGVSQAPDGKAMLERANAELDKKALASKTNLMAPAPDQETPAQKLARANDAAVKKWLDQS